VKHKTAVTDGIAVGYKPYHVIASDMRFVTHRILLPRFALVNAIRLKMLRNPVFLSIAYWAENFGIWLFINHITQIPLTQINSEAMLTEGAIALRTIPNQIVPVNDIVTVMRLIA